MNLSNDLITQFAKVLNDKPETKKESLVNGTAIKINGTVYARIDGSNTWTPVSTTAIIKSEDENNGERVTILVKDHSATIVGNTSTPAARSDDVDTMGMQVHELDIVTAYRVNADDITAIRATLTELKSVSAKFQEMSAVTAQIEELTAKLINTEYISAKAMDVIVAEIEQLKASFGEFGEIIADDAEFVEAQIGILNGHTANFNYVSTNSLKAVKAQIVELDVNKLSAEQADLRYANIDFTNIGEAAIDEFYAKSGIIDKLIIGEGVSVKELVGVTIKGDLIEAGTLRADKLVVKGDDGLYYKLNFEAGTFTDAEEIPTDSLHGSVITAKSITAEQINVHDLNAFAARIGGFNIGADSIYSGAKTSIDNTTAGTYLGDNGEFSFGDGNSYIRFYRELDENGEPLTDSNGDPIFRLAIAVDSLLFGRNTQSSTDDLKDLMDRIKMGSYMYTTVDEDDVETTRELPCIELLETDPDTNEPSLFKVRVTSKEASFMDGTSDTKIDADSITTDNVIVRDEFRQGPFAWTTRKSGNYTHYGLMWKGGAS